MKTMSWKMTKRLTVDKQSPGCQVASGGTQGVQCDLTEQNFPHIKRRIRRGEEREKEKKALYLYIFQ